MTELGLLSILEERLPKRKLSFTQKFFVLIGILFCLFLLLFGLLILGLEGMHSDEVIFGELTLSPDWVELTLDQPLPFPRQSQGIVLDVAEPLRNAEPLLKDNSNKERIQLMDGTLVHPELQVIDQNGKAINIQLWPALRPSRHENSISGYVRPPSEGVSYTKVRLRCDKPLRLSGVLWYSDDGK